MIRLWELLALCFACFVGCVLLVALVVFAAGCGGGEPDAAPSTGCGAGERSISYAGKNVCVRPCLTTSACGERACCSDLDIDEDPYCVATSDARAVACLP